MIEAGLKVAVGIALAFSPGAPREVRVSVPSIPAVERVQAVLPEELRAPGPSIIEDKRPYPNPKAPQSLWKERPHTKVRFS